MVALTTDGSPGRPGAEWLSAYLEAWQALGGAIPDILLLVDQQGVVLYVNRTPKSFALPELIGSSVFDLTMPEGREELRASLWETFARRSCRARELPVQHPDGTIHWYAAHTGPVCRDQEVIAAVILARDITDRKQEEEELWQHQKLEALGQLASEVAHDFNTILAVIASSNDLLSEQVGADPECAVELATIRAATLRGSAFTRQLLRFARNQHAEMERVDVHAQVAEVAAMLRRIIGNNVKLLLRLEATGAHIRARRGQMEQVLMNLILNARDALPAGGRITVSTATILGTEGPSLRLAVEDDGMGMDDTTRRRAFEPLFTTKSPDKGTGLGLSTVYTIVTQLGGEVRAQSQLGLGSRFEITLPTSGLS